MFSCTDAGGYREASKNLSEDMRSLAKKLPQVMSSSRAPRTVMKYQAGFSRWQDWAETQQISQLPADPFHVALYLVHLMQEARTASPLVTAVCSLSWMHGIHGFLDPCSSNVVKNVLQAARHTLARPKVRKSPFTKPLLERLYRELASSSLQDLQTLTLVVLGYAGLLRWDDLANILVDEIVVKSTYMALFLEVRKNDQFRHGNWVFISRWQSDMCPVSLVERLIEEGDLVGHVKLFGRIQRKKKGRQVIRGSLSYSRARELLREALVRIGADPDTYGLHSLRSCGASAAAAAGVPDRLIQRQGEWRSDAMKVYLEESLLNLLQVSKALAV